MFSRSVKKKQSKTDKDKKKTSSSENGENEEDYKLKMSESSNYVKFLQLTLEGSQSDEEGSPGDLDGYIEDDFVGEAFLSECDADVDASDRTEAGTIHVLVSVSDYGRNITCRYLWNICTVVYSSKNQQQSLCQVEESCVNL